MNLEQSLQTFLDESSELLTDMESVLLALEGEPSDIERRHALFRCVHTIKGSAGMFGLEQVVAFSHVVENVLDRLRSEEIQFCAELAQLLLRCRDHIALLVEDAVGGESGGGKGDGAALLEALAIFQAPAMERPIEEPPTAVSEATGGEGRTVGSDAWHVSLRFDPEVLRHGMDPLGFIRYLGGLGELRRVVTVADGLPEIDEMDPEVCYLGFEIELFAAVDETVIEEAFDFVRELCELRILPPHSDLERYRDLMSALPEGPARAGELLVASGALTPAERSDALALLAETPTREPGTACGGASVESGAMHQGQGEAAQPHAAAVRMKSAQHLRVQADKLDRLINLVGELVISSAAVALNAARTEDAATRESAAAMSLLVEEIRDSSLQLRMIPIGETFQRFQRVVHDVAAELGKDIRLSITGADTELDKTVVEKIGDPLTHLVRNACDHGVESVDQRLASGKPAQGTLRLNAYHESGVIVIEVGDDGSGLQRERILAKAVERGLVAADASPSDQDVFNLIFEPGFSTAEAVTNLSGRGVGMDVVRRNIEGLRGTVEVESAPGAGTTFRIRLPLTLAIIDGFLFALGDAAYVVPLEVVDECVEFTDVPPGEPSREDFLDLRGEVLPLIRVREHFGVDGPLARRQNVLVVGYGGQRVGLVVDELMGEHQTVIKPLGGVFAGVKGLSGSTILGNGKVALILDVPALIQIAMKKEGRVVGLPEAKGKRPAPAVV